MLGRVLGGIATSLLFSSFESWMVCEHNARGYDSSAMSDTFSLMYFGNSLCAIGAGMMAEAAAEVQKLTPFTAEPNPIWHYGGYCSPFDVSATFLFVGFFIITALWGENYGSTDVSDICKDFQTPMLQMKEDPSIPLAGAVISLFEGSMYIFVFNWTPALSAGSKTTPPFGLIFSIFMIACMGGSSLFSIAIKRISIAEDRVTNRSKGYGHVQFESYDDAFIALEKLDGLECMGRVLRVDMAVNRDAQPTEL
jgi:hypothetical protein